MNMPTPTRQKGFTLIELLLYIAIVGSLLTASSLFFATTVDVRVKNQSIVEVDQQGVFLMERVTQTIRNADSITAPTAGSSGASLTVAMPVPAQNPTIFTASGGGITIKKGAGAAVALLNTKVVISSLSFTNLSRPATPGVVRVSFTLSRVNPTGKNGYDYQKTFTSTAALRQP